LEALRLKKYCLPTDWYHVVCRGVQRFDNSLKILFTVDVGSYSWQNVVMEYIQGDERAKSRIVNVFKQLHTTLPDDLFSPLLEFTVSGARANLHISSMVDDTDPDRIVKRNIVLEAKLPTISPEVNVFAERNDTHFLRGTQHGGAKLPINPQKID